MKEIENPETVERYMDFFLENLPHRECIDLFLVVLGERPACLVMDPDSEEREKLAEFCREFGLSFREQESRNESLLSSSGFFISRDESRFKHLKDSGGRFYGFSDRDVGKFLGFPEEDIEFFAENIEDGPLEVKTRKVVEDLVSHGEIDLEDAKFVQLTTYVPRPEEENVKDALETGKGYRNALLEFDQKFDSSTGRRVLEEFFGQVLEE
ncbi:MAG: hypothetical protein ABEJ36_00475 [Candidatus Nanosalina sp.]